METLQQISNIIVLIAGVLGAITTIYVFFSKPTKGLKKKISNYLENLFSVLLDQKIPTYFLEHDLETRERYKQDREAYLNEIVRTVEKHFDEVIKKISANDTTQNERIDDLTTSMRDLLRLQISNLYYAKKDIKQLTMYEKEMLDLCYKQYIHFNGNSDIPRKYSRMSNWEIVDDDVDD